MEKDKIKGIVKKNYANIARTQSSCGCGCKSAQSISRSIGYSDEEMGAVPDANLGLGCGNPLALSNIKEGDIVLDLGSGAGFDAFLASKKVGPSGKVIGIDMTEEMIVRANENARKYNYSNVEFRLGDIESLPLADASIDIIISNCVINLAPDKLKVFKEAFRVLKPTGKMYISDIVLLDELSEEQKNDETLIAGCVGGALLKNDYVEMIKNSGFEINVLGENKEISKKQYRGLPLESLAVEAVKL